MTEQTTTGDGRVIEQDAVTPDDASGWPDVPDVPVHVAWIRVMRDVGVIRKAERNKQQNFNFRGIDNVVNAVGPVMRKHGVFVVPQSVADVKEERYLTAKPKETAMHGVIARFVWRVYGPRGDYFDMESLGESADAGDKACPKVHSVALRVALLESLMIPTDEIDPDAESHERAAHPDEEPADPDARDDYGRTSAEAQEYTVASRKLIAEGAARRLSPQAMAAAFEKREGHSIAGEALRDESGSVTGSTVTAAHVDAFREWFVGEFPIQAAESSPDDGGGAEGGGQS
jgi:hypothetical protein